MPEVKNVAIQRGPVDTLNKMRSQIVDLYSLIARNEQRFDIMLDAPSSAYNVFVDPLFDDDMRDAGIPQTAIIANQTLMLPLDSEIKEVELANEATLNYSHGIVINQDMKTKSMKINPYQNFEPMPVTVELDPAIDRYSESVVKELKKYLGSGNASRYSYTETETETEDYNLRQIPVKITASGLGPGEGVKVNFDSVEVNCDTKKADSSGNFTGTFTIPANILDRVDPLAQTFTLSESRLISGVDFWLSKKGRSNIRVEIRNVSLGYPTTETLASKIIQVNNLIANNWNRAIFDTPVFLNSDTEYAITILSDTSDHEVGITEIGDWDSSKGWVRSQAYSTGVLLSSSNASTWTAHQSADLAFRLLAANFTGNSKILDLGTFDLTGVTDIMPLAEVETNVTFILKQNNTEVARMQAWQVISFDTALNGVYELKAELSGSAKYSPVLGRYPQLLTSKLKLTGDYVSRAFTCGQNKRVMISTDEYAPHGSSIDIYIQTGENTYAKVDVSESAEIGSGWIQRKRFVNCNLGTTRLKIELRGSAEARPLVQSISAVVLDA